MQELTREQRLGRWEDRREIKNLMGRYMYSIMYNSYSQMFNLFWSGREDVCLGFNRGYYVGEKGIRRYYEAMNGWVSFQGRMMRDYFPETLGSKSDEEVFGIGPWEFKPMSMPVIAIAGDGRTAKGLWYSRGSYAKVSKSGPVSYWTWGVFCVDFVREGGVWRIWHLLNVQDVDHIAGQDWSQPDKPFPEEPGFESAEEYRLPEPSVPYCNRQLYSPRRPFTKLPELPEEYETFSDTFSYGV